MKLYTLDLFPGNMQPKQYSGWRDKTSLTKGMMEHRASSFSLFGSEG